MVVMWKLEQRLPLPAWAMILGSQKLQELASHLLRILLATFRKGLLGRLAWSLFPFLKKWGCRVRRFLHCWPSYTSASGSFGNFAQILGTVASADAERHCLDQQVCLGCYFLRRLSYCRRFHSSLWARLSEQKYSFGRIWDYFHYTVWVYIFSSVMVWESFEDYRHNEE
jgi:hypothetical protein